MAGDPALGAEPAAGRLPRRPRRGRVDRPAGVDHDACDRDREHAAEQPVDEEEALAVGAKRLGRLHRRLGHPRLAGGHIGGHVSSFVQSISGLRSSTESSSRLRSFPKISFFSSIVEAIWSILSLFARQNAYAVTNARPRNWAATCVLKWSRRTDATGSAPKSADPRVRFINRIPMYSSRFSIFSRVSSSAPFSSSGAGAIPQTPTIVAARAVAWPRSPLTPTEFCP